MKLQNYFISKANQNWRRMSVNGAIFSRCFVLFFLIRGSSSVAKNIHFRSFFSLTSSHICMKMNWDSLWAFDWIPAKMFVFSLSRVRRLFKYLFVIVFWFLLCCYFCVFQSLFSFHNRSHVDIPLRIFFVFDNKEKREFTKKKVWRVLFLESWISRMKCRTRECNWSIFLFCILHHHSHMHAQHFFYIFI